MSISAHATLDRSSMIDFVVVSSDLWPCVLDTRVKRGAELSTDHHLVGILWEVLREYGVHGSLLRAIQALYKQSWSLVCMAGSKSDSFPVRDGLRQGCSLSPILFIIFMDRISRRSQGMEGVWFGDLKVTSLMFANDVVLLGHQVMNFSYCWISLQPSAKWPG
ncbi:hypothetical protein SRHO_G00034080 [Serrasalmus rhombeus]